MIAAFSAITVTPDRDGHQLPSALEIMLAKDGVPNVVEQAVRSASDAALQRFGLKAYRMNLMSLFGDSWSPERLLATARNATISKMLGGWEYHHRYLPGLGAEADVPRLEGVPVEAIRRTLGKGRGLILMTFHIGHMRYLPSDVAHAGIDVCVPFAGDAFADYASARETNPTANLWEKFHFHNVEQSGGTIALARTLAKGGCIFSAIDGNTGIDGTQGSQQRTEVDVLGVRAKVKIGLFSLAARYGTPILILAAFGDGERKQCRVGPAIDPETRLAGGDQDAFVRSSAQTAYSFFGQMLESHADNWCGGDHFHQWRVPLRSPQLDRRDVAISMDRALHNGGRVALNDRRIVPLHSEKEIVWLDARSGSCYKLPGEMELLFSRLTEPQHGVDRDWLDHQPEPARAQMWSIICSLAAREAIVEVPIRQRLEGAKEATPRA